MRLSLLALLLVCALATPATADPRTVTPDDRTIGRADAPVTIIEYASLTCSHCAAFHQELLPELKRRHVETGNVRMVFRDFPLNRLALATAMLVRCTGGPEAQTEAFGQLLERHAEWTLSNRPLAAARDIIGLAEDEAEACLQREDLMEEIVAEAQAAYEEFGIEGTPSFSVNGGEARQLHSIEEIDAVVEEHMD